MKKILKIIIIIILIMLIIFGIPLYIKVGNDIIAKKVEVGLKNTKLPDKTEIIDSISIAGKLVGNGNGMQYFGAILIKTELSEYELNQHYKQYRNKKLEYNIRKQTSDKIEVIELGSYKFKKFKDDEKEKYYIIYSWGSNKNELLNLDIRGH